MTTNMSTQDEDLTKSGSRSCSGGNEASDIRLNVMNVLSSTLTPDLLQSYASKLDILSRSSYYIEVTQQDLPQPNEPYIPNPNILNMIDPFRFQRTKNVGNSQVKVSLALLEELYSVIRRTRDELEAFVVECVVELDEAAVQEKISSLLQMASDFEAVKFPSRLHLKHHLISDIRSSNVQLKLSLDVKMPVVFDKTLTRAFADSVVLHWYVEGWPQHEADEQFEIGFKQLQMTDDEEETQATMTTCATHCLKITGLMPNRCFEFSVKRADSDNLVYALWKDSIILKTTLEST